jgi:hypothetical protein
MAEVGHPEWVLNMSERDQLAWYIAIFESKGAIWDYVSMTWDAWIPPKPVVLVEGA